MMAPAPRLRELVEGVRTDTTGGDTLDRLSTAVKTANELVNLGDMLLGHYVAEARERGLSWIEISVTLGVTKQAVHKRFADLGAQFPQMERFTDRARYALGAAETAAVGLQHNFVGTEHILLGILAEPESIGALILADTGITTERVEQSIIDRIGRGGRQVKGRLPFTPRAQRALERTLDEALGLGHNYIGTEHLLLGLFAPDDSSAKAEGSGGSGESGDTGGLAPELLAEYGLLKDAVMRSVTELLTTLVAARADKKEGGEDGGGEEQASY